jgi:hypothetical protein
MSWLYTVPPQETMISEGGGTLHTGFWLASQMTVVNVTSGGLAPLPSTACSIIVQDELGSSQDSAVYVKGTE